MSIIYPGSPENQFPPDEKETMPMSLPCQICGEDCLNRYAAPEDNPTIDRNVWTGSEWVFMYRHQKCHDKKTNHDG